MTAKLRQLIQTTSEEIVSQVDDCLLTTKKRVRVEKLLTDFASKLEHDGELSAPPTPTT